MSQLQDLRARLRLDDSEFKRGISGAKGQATGLGGALKSALLPVAAALTAAFSARALFGGMMRGGAEIDQVAKSARALGASIGGFRALEMAAGEAGVAVETLRDQSINLERAMATGKADASLRALGLEAKALGEMDVDQRFAAISDRVQELGLSGGETAALLRNLGITNRDMTLALMQGGDAFRKARQDVKDYGLELSQVESDKIEAANDAIGRTALVGQYLRQTLATALLPAMGDLSRAFTDSLREGGLLRGMIDTLGGALRWVAGVFGDVGTIAAALGSWMRDLFQASNDTNGVVALLTGSLQQLAAPFVFVLDTAASLVSWFADLIQGAGGFGEALSALAGVGVEVFQRIGMGAEGMGRMMSAVASAVQGAFLSAFGAIGRRFAELTQRIAEGINGLFSSVGIKTGLAGIDPSGFAEIEARGADELGVAGRQAAQGLNFFRESAAPLQSVQALRDLVDQTRRNREETDNATQSAQKFKTALDDLAGDGNGNGGGGGGGGARGAAKAIDDVSKAAKDAATASEQWADKMAGHFDGLITGGKGLSGVLQSMARQLESEGWRMLFRGLAGGGALGGGGGGGLFSWIGGLFGIGKNANGTNNWRGGLSWVGERGPELVNLPRGSQVFDAQTSAGMMRRGATGGGMNVSIGFDASVGGFTALIRDEAGRVVAQAAPAIVGQAVGATYDRAARFPIPGTGRR